MNTLLDRTQGSALDIEIGPNAPLSTIARLSHHARRIKHLDFPKNLWSQILMFSQVDSGSLPLLRTLSMHVITSKFGQLNLLDIPSPSLFSSAVNLKEFTLNTQQAGLLKHFVFPNLTTLKLSAPKMDELNTSHLFNFLKASPTLRTVNLTIDGGMMLGSIPKDMVLVLPNVETFSVFLSNNDLQAYGPVVHISCPRAKCTSISQEIFDKDMVPVLEIFPDSVSLAAIAQQYTTSPVEEVTLEIEDDMSIEFVYSLTFRSSDATVIELSSGVAITVSEGEDFGLSWDVIHLEIFSQACRTIRSHPLLSHIKRLHFEDKTGTLGAHCVIPMAEVVRDLFRSLGPLEELTIRGFDLQIFLSPFLDLPEFQQFQRIFPPVKELTISEKWMVDKQRCADAIVELAKSQYDIGKRFERITIHASEVPTALAERLRQWVNVADCYELLNPLSEEEEF